MLILFGDLIGHTISSAVEWNLHRRGTRPFSALCEEISGGRGWLARLAFGIYHGVEAEEVWV